MSDPTRLRVHHYYNCCATGDVELPDGKGIQDIDNCYVKWGSLHVNFKDGESIKLDVGGNVLDSIDWKRPNSVEVFQVDEDDNVAYDYDMSESLGCI